MKYEIIKINEFFEAQTKDSNGVAKALFANRALFCTFFYCSCLSFYWNVAAFNIDSVARCLFTSKFLTEMNLNRIPAYIKAGEKCLKEFPTVNMGDRDSIYMDTIIVYYSLNLIMKTIVLFFLMLSPFLFIGC